MKNPCLACGKLHADKKGPPCTNCEKRTEYVQYLGCFPDPKEITVKEDKSTAPPPAAGSAGEPPGKTTGKDRTCDCGQSPVVARGKCRRCYDRLYAKKKTKSKIKASPKPKAPETSPETGISTSITTLPSPRPQPDDDPATVFDYEALGRSIGNLVAEKQKAYGDSFGKAGAILNQLYPDGIQPSQYTDLLCLVRMIDKLFRIATSKDAFGENPFMDIAGYALLGTANGQIKSTTTGELS